MFEGLLTRKKPTQPTSKSMTFSVGDGMSAAPLSNNEILKLGQGPIRSDKLDPVATRQQIAQQQVRKAPELQIPTLEAKVPIFGDIFGKKIQFAGNDILRQTAAGLIELPEKVIGQITEPFVKGGKLMRGESLGPKNAKDEYLHVNTYTENAQKNVENGMNPVLAGAIAGLEFVADASIVGDALFQAGKIPIKTEIARLTRQDLIDITAGRITSGAKYDAFKEAQNIGSKIMEQVKAGSREGIQIGEKKVVTLGDYVKSMTSMEARPGFAKVPGNAAADATDTGFTTRNLKGGDILRRHKVSVGGKTVDVSINDIKELDDLINTWSSRKPFTDTQSQALVAWGERLGVKDNAVSVIKESKRVVDDWTRRDMARPAFAETTGRPDILDSQMVSGEQALSQAKDVQRRLKLTNIDNKIVDQILTGDGGTAFARALGNEILYTGEVPKFTGLHETIHIVHQNVDNIKLFTDQGITRAGLNRELRAISGGEDIREILAENGELLAQYKESIKPKSMLGRFIDATKKFFKRVFSKDKRSQIRKFLDTTLEGKAKVETRIPDKKTIPAYAIKEDSLATTFEPTAKTPQAFAKAEQKKEIRAVKRETMDKAKAIYDKKVAGIKDAKEILARRRQFIRAVQEQFGLTDGDLKSITRRDIRLMSNQEFKTFLDDIRVKSEKLAEQKVAYNELQAQIKEKELNIEPLREAMNLPRLSDMSTVQLREMDGLLSQYQKGDVFLSKRKLETIERTELQGIKTYREAREVLAKKLGTKPEELNTINVRELDRLRGDASLAERNPFFRMMIEEKNKVLLIRNAEYLEIKDGLMPLVKKLKTNLIQKLVPQQKNIAAWFEATDKSTVAITKEEAAVINYMQEEWSKALEYLVEQNALKKGINQDNYFTHIRRGVLEAVKEDGLKQAFLELLDQNKLTEQTFNILEGNTGEIMALDKFFRFAMHRTGGLKYSDNVVGSFLNYMKTFKKKQALDEIVPLIDIYANSLTPKGTTKTGLLLHGDLVRFTKEWLNTQKGRRVTLLAKQGGKIDLLLRAGKSMTSLMDLGLNAAVNVFTQVGEQIVTYQLLGKAKYLESKVRALTPQGRKIIKKYENFIGESPWKQLIEPARAINDRIAEAMFVMFQDANVRRTKNFLLGSMTKEEFASGVISPERLASLKIDLARYAVVDGAKSIMGATPEVGQFTQYKSWAIPIMRTTLSNLRNLQKLFTANKEPGKKALLELYRMAELTGIVALFWVLFGYDEKDESFLGKMKRKAYSESFSLIQALNPQTLFTEPRTFSFVRDLADNLTSIVMLEEYKESKFGEYKAGDLKGVNKLIQQLTPRAIKQFEPIRTKTLEDIKAEIKADLEAGVIDVATAKVKFADEVSKLNAAVKKKRFDLPLKEYKADLKARIKNNEISVSDAKDEFTEYSKANTDSFESVDDSSFIEKVSLYAKAIGTDPVTAFHRIFTGDYIRRIDNGAIIVYRLPVEKSQELKKRLGATKDLILDHTMPLELGGSNGLDNLKLVTVDQWESYTPIENYLGDKLRAGLITKKEAQDLIKKLKNGEITAAEITQ